MTGRPRLPSGDRRGVVLLLVLATIALFTVMVVNFSADEGLDMQLAYNFRDSVQAQYVARSGVEAAVALLKKDDTAYDAEDEDWGDFGQYAMGAAQYLDNQTISGSITDESGRFDLNCLGKAEGLSLWIEQFVSLVLLLEIDTEVDPRELAYALRDWIDEDDDDGGNGAEERYYLSLENPYHCKNGPLDCPEEILLVKGMKPEYYYGTDHYKGLRDYVAVGTGGRINVNTASEAVLRSVSKAMDNDGVIKAVRDGRPWKVNQADWAATLGVTASGDEREWIKKVLTNTTEVFRADMKGSLPSGAQMNVMAILQRVQSDVKIVYYKIY